MGVAGCWEALADIYKFNPCAWYSAGSDFFFDGNFIDVPRPLHGRDDKTVLRENNGAFDFAQTIP